MPVSVGSSGRFAALVVEEAPPASAQVEAEVSGKHGVRPGRRGNSGVRDPAAGVRDPSVRDLAAGVSGRARPREELVRCSGAEPSPPAPRAIDPFGDALLDLRVALVLGLEETGSPIPWARSPAPSTTRSDRARGTSRSRAAAAAPWMAARGTTTERVHVAPRIAPPLISAISEPAAARNRAANRTPSSPSSEAAPGTPSSRRRRDPATGRLRTPRRSAGSRRDPRRTPSRARGTRIPKPCRRSGTRTRAAVDRHSR